MRQITSSGSVKAIWLDKEKILERLRDVSIEALNRFPEIKEVRVFGSVAKGEETGLSDVDIFILIENEQKDTLERMKPYFSFFSDRLDIAIDMIVATKDEVDNLKDILKESILLYRRGFEG